MHWRKMIAVVVKFAGGLLLLIVAAFCVLLFLLYNDDVDVKRFSSIPSANNAYSLNIDVANPSLPFGSHTIEISVTNTSNETVLRDKFRLSNDGANISAKNIESHWIDNDTAAVCLRGDEQRDVKVSIRVASQQSSEEVGC